MKLLCMREIYGERQLSWNLTLLFPSRTTFEVFLTTKALLNPPALPGVFIIQQKLPKRLAAFREEVFISLGYFQDP